jgi:RNA-directed DNA polymerase
MTNDETNRAARVTGPTQPKQVAEIRDRWWWIEHSVWTDRMLTRLEESEPTTVWFGLWDKVLSGRNLQAAFWAVWRNDGAPGVDGQTVKQFDEQLEPEMARLREELHTQRYRRQPARRVWIPKPGTTERRPLGIPAVRDRTVEAALRHVLEPIFERDFAEASYGFRPGRGCGQAVARVEELLSQGRVYCVDADLKSYLDPCSYYTLAVEGGAKSCGWLSNTRMRKPFCLPRLTWTTESSPRLTRCMMVWRETPSMRMA